MKNSSIYSNGFVKNNIFDVNNELNRDNCYYPYFLLKEKFFEKGILLETSDLAKGKDCLFEIHQDIPLRNTGVKSNKKYLLLMETKYIRPEHEDFEKLRNYDIVFSWDESLKDKFNFIKLNYPNKLEEFCNVPFSERNIFCCLIASNKTLPFSSRLDLYIERVKSIRFFEKKNIDLLHLYGNDWDIPAIGTGVYGRITRKFFKKIKFCWEFNSFPSYKGRLKNKSDALKKTKFCICYENVKNVKGYITEKIFDCFLSGCVPIYWGADDILDYVPEDCFIDRRKFKNHEELYEFMMGIDDESYKKYQNSIMNFLDSSKAHLFSAEHFANLIVKNIIDDIKSL